MSDNKKITPIFGGKISSAPSASSGSIFDGKTPQTTPSLFGGQSGPEPVFGKPPATTAFGASSFGMLNKGDQKPSGNLFGKSEPSAQSLFGGLTSQGTSQSFKKSSNTFIAPVFGKKSVEPSNPLKSSGTNMLFKPLQHISHTKYQSTAMETPTRVVNPDSRPILSLEDPFDDRETPKPPAPTSLVAMEIPQRFCDRKILVDHFKKFGKLDKVVFYPSTQKASIHYVNAKSAAKAKANGKSIHPNFPEMIILFGTNVSPKKKTKKSSKPDKTSSETIKPIEKKPDIRTSSPLPKPKPSFISSDKDSQSLIKSQAHTNTEKYEVLEARDKLLRARQMKVSDVKKAKYLAASCPDMCPEKERYMRDIQYDLSSYEMTDGSLDHRLVIKKFSRSSADKDEPLPHELRPGPVLRLTIDYLVSSILDDTQMTTEVWYNYLWNRTRALRNDIMQQHLVSSDAVYVLERCVRFHIHCAHAHCEQSPDTFDPKMNDEHLFKSLQSLKEAYHDLAERNEYFTTESEFRSYEILLNLQDGDLIYKFQNLRDCVRKSSEVSFAVQCLHALHSKNYIRFFRLVHKATYLQACILHRYYNDMRAKAMSVITKSYSTLNKSQNVPLQTFKNMLGLNSDSELTAFLDVYNLGTDGDCVVIEKKSLNSSIQMPCSMDQVTKSKLSAVSKIVHGSNFVPVRPTASWTPHDSFDAKGYLKSDAITGEDQLTHKASTEILPLDMSEDQLQEHLQEKMAQMYQLKLLQKCFSHWRLQAQKEKKVKAMVAKRSLRLVGKFSRLWLERVEKSRARKQIRNQKIMRRTWDKWMAYTRRQSGLRSLRDYVKQRTSSIVCIKVYKTWRKYVLSKQMVKRMKIIRIRILTRKFWNAWIDFVETQRKNRLADDFFDRKLVSSAFIKWKHYIELRKENKQMDFLNFPAAITDFSSKQINDVWAWGFDRQLSENMTPREIQILDAKICDRLSKISAVQALEDELVWKPFPFLDRFQEFIEKPINKENFYNCYAHFFLLIDSSVSKSYVYWIRNKFCLDTDEDIRQPLDVTRVLTSKTTGSSFQIVIKENSLDDFEKPEMTSCTIVLTSDSKLETTRMFLDKHECSPNLILSESSYSQLEGDIWKVSLEDLRCTSISVNLYSRIVQLWFQFVSDHKVSRTLLYDALEGFVYDKVMNPIIAIAQQRLLYSYWTTHPNILVEFYNDAVTYFTKCIIRKNCSDGEIENLLLPPFVLPETPSYDQKEDSVQRYLKIMDKDRFNINLTTQVQHILNKCKRTSFPWLDLFDVFIGFKLSSLSGYIVWLDNKKLQKYSPKVDYISFLNSFDEPVHVPAPTPKRKLDMSSASPTPEEPVAKKTKLLLQNIEKEKEKMKAMEKEVEELLQKLGAGA